MIHCNLTGYTVSLVLTFKPDDNSPELKHVAKTSNQYMKVVVLTVVKEFCVLHVQSNTIIFYLVVQ